MNYGFSIDTGNSDLSTLLGPDREVIGIPNKLRHRGSPPRQVNRDHSAFRSLQVRCLAGAGRALPLPASSDQVMSIDMKLLVVFKSTLNPSKKDAKMDPILYWNDVALEANRVSHSNGKGEQTGPTLSSRALGIVHLAMHDAFFGVQGKAATYPLYLSGLPTPSKNASAQAAVAAAAHATLSELFPSQKPFFDRKHADAGIQEPGTAAGHAFGRAVAVAMLDNRRHDPTATDNGYSSSAGRGAHRPDPDNPNQGFHAPFYGARSKCFAVSKRHELLPPPVVGDSDYLRALSQVREKGIAPHLIGTLQPNASPRTAAETVIGVYWGYDGANGLGTPPRLYNQIVREVAKSQNNTPEQNARLFALINVAMADAGILAWDQKYIHDLWRPILGIREGDYSMGPAGYPSDNSFQHSDPHWLPLGAPSTNSTSKNFTPPFPAYPSGHATFGAAAFQITRLFYGIKPGDRNPDSLFKQLTFVSEELNGVNSDNAGTVRPRHVRSFTNGLWQMIEENGLSRVYLGVHWFFDAFFLDENGTPDLSKNIGGIPLGLVIAEDIFCGGLIESKVGPRY